MDFKALKQSMEQVFGQIKSRALEGELPLESDVTQFLRLSRQFLMQAEETWLDEAEDFVHLVAQLQQAVKNRHLEEAIVLVDSLGDSQAYCHRTYLG